MTVSLQSHTEITENIALLYVLYVEVRICFAEKFLWASRRGKSEKNARLGRWPPHAVTDYFHKGNSGPMLVRKCPPKLYLFLSIQISSAAFPRSICGVKPGNIAGSILATCHGRCVAPQIQIFWHLMVLLVAICGNHQRQLHFVHLCSAPCFAGRIATRMMSFPRGSRSNSISCVHVWSSYVSLKKSTVTTSSLHWHRWHPVCFLCYFFISTATHHEPTSLPLSWLASQAALQQPSAAHVCHWLKDVRLAWYLNTSDSNMNP